MSYTYTNENPYCEASRAENVACRADFGVAEVKPVQLNQHGITSICTLLLQPESLCNCNHCLNVSD